MLGLADGAAAEFWAAWLSQPLSQGWTHREHPANKDRSAGAGLPWARPTGSACWLPLQGLGGEGWAASSRVSWAAGQSAGQGSLGATTRPSTFPSPQRKGEVNKPITLGNEAK